ncbi:MAG: SH3 domain-containing protein [Betaproteobacteria bacterium]|nr:SH3 domain-containing protein [Betaproteobacteria bacterium]
MKAFLVPACALVLCVAAAPALAASGTVLRNDKLYSQPSATSKATASVNRGTSVNILARQGGWLRVSAGRSTGWIRLLSVRAGAGGLGGAGLGDVVGAATTRSNPSRVVAVAGLRGLNDEDLKQAKFNGDELARLNAWQATPAQARSFASQGGLKTANVAALPAPQPEQKASPWEAN